MSVASKQIEHNAAAWLASRDAGNWTEQEHSALEAWLSEDVANRVAFVRLSSTWAETGRLATLGAGTAHDNVPGRGEWAHSLFFKASADDTCNEVAPARRTTHRTRHKRWPMAVGVAASLLFVIMIATSVVWLKSQHVERGAWQTAVGAQKIVQLADGSTVTLSSDTELRMALSRDQRDLDLVHGEAFFDVAKDRARPFVVHVNGRRVVAVGTRFSVRRDGESTLRVVVTQGLVQLRSGHDSNQIIEDLPVGSIATVNGDHIAVRHLPLAQAREYLSWRSGYVVFRDTPLADAVAEFNRYNRQKIVITDPTLDNLRVGGNFRVDNGGAFVRLLQQVLPVRARQRDHHVALSRRDQSAATD